VLALDVGASGLDARACCPAYTVEDERKVGAFERKIRLGTRANPASIDADGITAKLEDGVLRVEVPKLDSGYVEIRKVDIQ
jgi:HSP20 family protein